MFGVIAIGIAFLIAKKLDDAGDYKDPKVKTNINNCRIVKL
ncbi:hypothetical protein [Flavicella sediminum]|nr:hypothetical protein [Flavicella sediminum]